MTYRDKYQEVFDDIFPTMEYQGLSNEEIEEKAKECIEKGKNMHILYPINYTEDIY